MKKISKFNIELYKSIKVLMVLMLMVLFLGGCRIDEANYELTNYKGKSIESFEKKTKTQLKRESNGIYSIEDTLQLIAPKEKISSITVLEGSRDYKLFGVEIGMNKEQAEQKINDIYGKEKNKTIDSDKNSITHTYRDKESEFYISYDIDTEKVTEMSYYYLKSEDNEAEDSVNAGELIALVGDVKVYYNEAMVYLKSAQENYETDYGKGIWDVDLLGDGRSFEQYIKEEVLKQIIQLKVIREEAEKEGITLTAEEKADAAAYAHEHFSGLFDEDIDRYLVNRELLEMIYSDNILAEKVFETKTIDVDTNVSDITAKQITVQHILVNGTELDDQGKRIPLSIEKRQAAFEKVNTLLEKARSGEDFYLLAEANSEAEEIEYTFGRGGAPQGYSKAFEQAAFNLKSGEVSDIVTTEYGWHIIYCVTDFNVDATIRVKEEIIEERRMNLFAELYSDWSANYDVVINSDVWGAISLKAE
ncbi:MAG: hypothetical protein GX321_08500 [Clostridiales bacterium]|nr:hypothetical protein [Clostridiales bacterium]